MVGRLCEAVSRQDSLPGDGDELHGAVSEAGQEEPATGGEGEGVHLVFEQEGVTSVQEGLKTERQVSMASTTLCEEATPRALGFLLTGGPEESIVARVTT